MTFSEERRPTRPACRRSNALRRLKGRGLKTDGALENLEKRVPKVQSEAKAKGIRRKLGVFKKENQRNRGKAKRPEVRQSLRQKDREYRKRGSLRRSKMRRGDSCFAALRLERSRFFQGKEKSKPAFLPGEKWGSRFFCPPFSKFFQLFQKNSPALPVAPARRAQGVLCFICGIFHFFLPAHSTLSSLAGKGLFPWN